MRVVGQSVSDVDTDVLDAGTFNSVNALADVSYITITASLLLLTCSCMSHS